MNLTKFLQQVSDRCNELTIDEFKTFIHEQARILEEHKREQYLQQLLNINTQNSISLEKQYNNLIPKIQKINKGKLCIEIIYNDYYNEWERFNDEEEFLFYDHSGISNIVNSMYQLLQDCIVQNNISLGFKIISDMLNLKITASGDYYETGYTIVDLHSHGLSTINTKDLILNALYIYYLYYPIYQRSEILYTMIEKEKYIEIKLEEILQIGHDLLDFEDFLPIWIDYLGKKETQLAHQLLLEAIDLLNNDKVLLLYANKYLNTHPALMESYFEKQLKLKLSKKELNDLYDLAENILQKMNVNLIARSQICKIMINISKKTNRKANYDKLRLEVFRSNSTVENYLDLILNCSNYFQYKNDIKEICNTFKQKEDVTYSEHQHKTENIITNNTYLMLSFFQKDFDYVINKGINHSQAVGWRDTFMKDGICAFLMLLSNETNLKDCCFDIYLYVSKYIGEIDDKNYHKSVINNYKKFLKWKKTVHLSDEQKQQYLNHIKKMIAFRVEGIMNGKFRNYYEECALFVGALGEVEESLGLENGKQVTMNQYRKQYSKYQRFIGELKEKGMIHQ